jgi:hypothetical protein
MAALEGSPGCRVPFDPAVCVALDTGTNGIIQDSLLGGEPFRPGACLKKYGKPIALHPSPSEGLLFWLKSWNRTRPNNHDRLLRAMTKMAGTVPCIHHGDTLRHQADPAACETGARGHQKPRPLHGV